MALQFLVVGTGRDGTVSLTQIINDIFRLNGIKAEAAHEYLSRDCYEAYCLFKETGDEEHRNRLRLLMRACPYQAIVGNGYASVLPLFQEAFPNVALIHVRRADREATIRSHHKNSLLFPETYINYGPRDGIMRRVAAFHEGEMSRADWEEMSLHDRFAWFYDYTHATIEANAPRFRRRMSIETESISDPATLETLSRFILDRDGHTPKPVHLNRHVYLGIDDFSEAARSYAQWMFGNLSAPAIEANPIHLADYITNKLVALLGYQISGFIDEFAPHYARPPAEVLDSLNEFEGILRTRLNEVRLLRNDVLERLSIRGSLEPRAKSA